MAEHSSTQRTRVLVVSDTHGTPLEGGNPQPFKLPLPKADLLIHCGDLTMTGAISEYHDALNMLKDIDAPVKLVIAGNHDLSLDQEFVLGHAKDDNMSDAEARLHVKEAHNLWTSPDGRAKREGITYLSEGLHQVDLPSGARVKIYASPYTPEFCDWGFPYEKYEDRFNSPLQTLADASNIAHHPVPSFTSESPIDILLTHGPPFGRLDKTQDGLLVGCPHLLRAVMRARPLLHCFGHIHEGWGAERVSWSSEADQAAEAASSIADWKSHGWTRGVSKDVSKLSIDREKVVEQHGVFVDVSSDGTPLKRGQETLMVNAAIMNIRYRPVNGPWLITLDLPKSS